MIILIDNYDSFSYNLYQVVGVINPDIKVIRNDEYTVDQIEEMKPSHIIISPGPGRPENAGICEEVVKRFKNRIPILGVCLGHQGICEALGAKITYAKELMHGKTSVVDIDNGTFIFSGLKSKIKVARYHSLAVDESTLPDELGVIGRADDGEIMAVSNKEGLVYGLQFHPESILTPDGRKIMENFLAIEIA
ncbi:MAG: aminodeoxychorismate/anthranilate synthase component II [Eubacterium sp.]|nr:aminodeoxychorismate/anthranilate synthase component II [Eubacterium sp.]